MGGVMTSRASSVQGLLDRVRSESLAALSDWELVKRFAEAGDEVAFGAIVDRHGPMLLGLCRRLVSDCHLADDVLQATFLVLARKAGTIRRRDSLASWLYSVTRRVARQARLAEAARSQRERRSASAGVRGSERDPGWDELLHVLDEELDRLPQSQRAPLLLCYLQGRTQDEAARQLGWSFLATPDIILYLFEGRADWPSCWTFVACRMSPLRKCNYPREERTQRGRAVTCLFRSSLPDVAGQLNSPRM